MSNDIARPKTLVVAAVLLGLSLALTVYGEIKFSIDSIAAGATSSFAFGRLVVPLLWIAAQACLLYMLVQGRNWARVLVIVVVALAIVVRYINITSPLAQAFGPAVIVGAVVQTVAEVIAVLLLLTTARNSFSPRASA